MMVQSSRPKLHEVLGLPSRASASLCKTGISLKLRF